MMISGFIKERHRRSAFVPQPTNWFTAAYGSSWLRTQLNNFGGSPGVKIFCSLEFIYGKMVVLKFY